MEFLRTLHTRGYPAEYLQARIRGRMERRIADWEPILLAADPLAAVPAAPWRGALTGRSEELVWKSLLQELAWLYSQMDAALRGVFFPLFGYFELRTIVLCLRNMGNGNSVKIEELLTYTLLDERIKEVMREGSGPSAAVEALAAIFAAGDTRFARLRKAYGEHGLAGFERELADLYLEGLLREPSHPIMAAFFSRLIDTINTLTLYKHLRWGLTAPPHFVQGGSIGSAVFVETAEKKEMGGAALLLRRLTGEEAAPYSSVGLEQLLLQALARCTRRWGREESGMGLILDYIWRCRMEARNLSLLIHGGELERETLRLELVH